MTPLARLGFVLLSLGLVVPPLSGCGSTPGAATGGTVLRAGSLSAEARPLAQFFAQLQALESGQRSQPVTIIHLGDSHTAGDKFSGRLRQLFQDRFGAAGRGTMPPGVPFDYYQPTLVSVEQSGDWVVDSSFGADHSGIFGISGFRSTSDDPDARMILASEESAGFDRVEIVVLTRPGGGTLEVSVDGRVVHHLPTEGSAVRAARLDLPVSANSRTLTVRPEGDGPVTLLSWATRRGSRGIVYESHGIVGTTINIVGRWEPSTLAWEIGHSDPGLIVVAYGTNEGFDDDLTYQDYAAAFQVQLRALRRAAPNASIVVVGPPDADRLPRGCDGEEYSCAPVAADEVPRYETLYRSQRTDRQYCRWHPPPNLGVVRQVQRTVAASEGVYFWDWSQVMGGDCGTHRWAVAEPPLAYNDHVHFRTDGYRMSGDALFQDLMRLYAAARLPSADIAQVPR